MDKIYDIITRTIKEENILRDELLSKHTTFRIGGKADYFVKPASENEVVVLVKELNENNIDFYIMGNGSNILASDDGYRGVIVYIGENLSDIELLDESTIKAGAGAMLSKVARVALDNSLSGMEFASGIPGSVGGAVVMNAGAYGGEIKDIVVKVKVCDKSGRIFEIANEELDFSYRHSAIQEEGYIVLGAIFTLKPGNKEEISRAVKEISAKRKEKQPLEYPSAGSTFKRPEGYYAGKLIMDAGLRGYRVGGAMVSEKHCGFVINADNATASDVKKLMEDVADKVEEQYGVRLEPEVKFL